MRAAARILGQIAVYAAIAAVLGYFSQAPAYVHAPPGKAMIKLSFSHGAKAKGGCRRLTAKELADLAPNMRRPFSCPRQRLPVVVELDLDGRPLYRAVLPPTGLAGDGPSRVYRRFVVDPGDHDIVVRLRDTDRKQGFDYRTEARVKLVARQNLVIDFSPTAGRFVIR